MLIRIYFNYCYKNSCDLVFKDVTCKYFNVSKNSLIIDNQKVVNSEKIVNSVEFYQASYKNIIELNSERSLRATDLYYKKEKRIDVDKLNNFIIENF